MPHETKTVVINGENVEIDRLMVSFIKWLNQLPSVRTIFCCEGSHIAQPYVKFLCHDDEDLRLILSKVQPTSSGEEKETLNKLLPDVLLRAGDTYVFAKCEVKMSIVSKNYLLLFTDKGNLRLFNEFMRFHHH